MSNFKPGPILKSLESTSELRKKLSTEELPDLCAELRRYIIDVVSEKGGHLGASLGTVELSVALHYVYNTPDDQLVWDVGHQAYAHKILTGRRDTFPTNRQWNGISGFPRRSESEYDAFGVGHSSTSISAVLGTALASKLKNETREHIAVIGDGAMTGGQAFEALNHAGAAGANITIILNDNGMSIDPNVGALKDHFDEISSEDIVIANEAWIKSVLAVSDTTNEERNAALLQGLHRDSKFFSSLNIAYYGPIDGHNTTLLVSVLEALKSVKGPKVLHCVTTKGKGYDPAEMGSATKWHAPGLFNKITGAPEKKNSASLPPKFQDVFGTTIVELAKMNDKIVGVTPAMPTGSSLNKMMEVMPDRAFDVGIAEQHAVTFSAGLATQGMTPFCNIYSTFMQRAYDQLIHDVALQELHVIFCLDRAGLVGADGATHQGVFDFAFLRCIPNIIIASPMNESELRILMYTSQLNNQGTWAIRYPRGRGVLENWETPMEAINVGTGRCIREGTDLAVISIGPMGNMALKVAQDLAEQGHDVAHYDLRFLKPLDHELLHEIFANFNDVITVEDGCIEGGMGSSI
ncbi:MAG: 1-deoxy-D-xylulose-5-phosphate synthase, partial [Flavobacteriales bacterium]|nr:1-deoxy-D-xylulose-5-phosphate synthase [Flavobacteriales bacterium]